MKTDVLIIGQGISGSLLYWNLKQLGWTSIVMDMPLPGASSQASAGIINPVTGRRYSQTWRIDELYPFAVNFYGGLGEAFQTRYLHERTVLDFFPSPFSRENFLKLLDEGNKYTHSYPDQNRFNDQLHYEFGVGEIRPAASVNVGLLLADLRGYMMRNSHLVEEEFESGKLNISSDGISYGNIDARYLIFCDGVASATNPWFQLLPFALNKGEALIIEAKGLSPDHIYKKSMLICPLPLQDVYWVGSVYQREFADSLPTAAFREQFEAQLKHFLKVPFEVKDHRAGIRPATLERRPFAGLHPVHERIGILNGMGTKGISLAPFFSRELALMLVEGQALSPEVDVRRFSRVLSRSQ